MRQQHQQKQGKRFGHNFSASNKSEHEKNIYIRDESEVDDYQSDEDARKMDSGGSGSSREEGKRSEAS